MTSTSGGQGGTREGRHEERARQHVGWLLYKCVRGRIINDPKQFQDPLQLAMSALKFHKKTRASDSVESVRTVNVSPNKEGLVSKGCIIEIVYVSIELERSTV